MRGKGVRQAVVRIIDKEHTAKHLSVVWLLLLLEITQKKMRTRGNFRGRCWSIQWHSITALDDKHERWLCCIITFSHTHKNTHYFILLQLFCALTVPKLLLTVWNKFLVNLITVFVNFQHIIWGLFQWKSIYRDISMGRRVTFRCWIWRWLRFNIFKRERRKSYKFNAPRAYDEKHGDDWWMKKCVTHPDRVLHECISYKHLNVTINVLFVMMN